MLQEHVLPTWMLAFGCFGQTKNETSFDLLIIGVSLLGIPRCTPNPCRENLAPAHGTNFAGRFQLVPFALAARNLPSISATMWLKLRGCLKDKLICRGLEASNNGAASETKIVQVTVDRMTAVPCSATLSQSRCQPRHLAQRLALTAEAGMSHYHPRTNNLLLSYFQRPQVS